MGSLAAHIPDALVNGALGLCHLLPQRRRTPLLTLKAFTLLSRLSFSLTRLSPPAELGFLAPTQHLLSTLQLFWKVSTNA